MDSLLDSSLYYCFYGYKREVYGYYGYSDSDSLKIYQD